jgi:hypothetical protein
LATPHRLWFRRAIAVVALDRVSGEAQIEALDQPGDAAWVHLELVAGAEVGQSLGVGLRDSSELDEFGEESLEAGRRDDLEKPRRLIAGVPEGVPLVTRLEDQVAGAADHVCVPETSARCSVRERWLAR